jgi:hypothetical protein
LADTDAATEPGKKIKQASVEALKRPEMKSSSVASLPIN